MTGPVLLLDAMSLVYRAYHALPPMNTKAGEPTSGLYGFASLLCKLLREERPAGIALALDSPQQTERRASYDAYKAGRAPMADALRPQVAELPALAAALGAPAHRVPGKEADDLLATLAAAIPEPTLVVSGDTDLIQVVTPRTTVLFVGRRQADHVRYDPASVEAKYGFPAERMPTYKAMVGDPSDNLPGVAGLGAKTAARLCAAFPDIDAMVAAAADPRVVANADALRRWEALGRLERDVALAEPRWAPLDPDGLLRWFARWEFESLRKRLAVTPGWRGGG